MISLMDKLSINPKDKIAYLQTNPLKLDNLNKIGRIKGDDPIELPLDEFEKELKELAPIGNRRMGSNPHANGGILLKELRMPDYREYGFEVGEKGSNEASDMMELGRFIRDIIKLNKDHKNFRIFDMLI